MSRTHELFVSGRLCLFGEHSDWAGGHRRSHPELQSGWCLVSGTDQGLRAEAEAADGVFELESALATGEVFGPLRIPADADSLRAAAAREDFFSYAAGTAAEIRARHDVGGLALRIRSDLPAAKGLSSSAAVSVLTARAYSRVYELALTTDEEMELAYAGERRAGSACGRMDQVCAHGRVVTALRFDADAWSVERIALGGSFAFLIVDLLGAKDTRRILRDLGACFPDAPGALAAGVRAALGPRNRDLHWRARAALEAGDAPLLGALMREAQALFDAHVAPACPELRAPRLHALLAHPAVAELAHGAKGVGSQGDGCAQILARGPDERAALATRLERELGVGCLPLTLAPEPAAGAGGDPAPASTVSGA